MRIPTRTALLIVDMQIDLCENGAIGIDGAREVAERISGYVTAHSGQYALIISVRDIHPVDHPQGEHIEPPDRSLFAVPHCVEGTHGADYNYNIINIEHDINLHAVMGLDGPSDSAFDAAVPSTGKSVMRVLTDHGITTVHTVGVPLERQVAHTAIDAVENQFTSVVLIDMCAAASVPARERSVEGMQAHGVHIQRTATTYI